MDDLIKTRIQHHCMSSGIRIVTGEMPYTNSVSILLLLNVGSRYESNENAGLFHLFEHVLFKGTKKRPSPKSISYPIESVGGVLNAFTGREETGYWCKLASKHFKTGIEVLLDMVTDPLIKPEDIEDEKQVIIEEIHANQDLPLSTAELNLDKILWPLHPLGRSIAGTVESVNGISREVMLDCLENQYISKNIVIAVAGAVTCKKVVECCEEILNCRGIRSTKPTSMFKQPVVSTPINKPLCFEERNTNQTYLAIGMQGVSFYDKRQYALAVISIIMGETMSSRLFTEIREKRGLAYDISSYCSFLSDTGAFYIVCGIDVNKLKEVTDCVSKEIALMKNRKITTTELEYAKEYMSGRMLLSTEESRTIAGIIGKREAQSRSITSLNEIINAIKSVTLDEVIETADSVLQVRNTGISVVGPTLPNGLLDVLDF